MWKRFFLFHFWFCFHGTFWRWKIKKDFIHKRIVLTLLLLKKRLQCRDWTMCITCDSQISLEKPSGFSLIQWNNVFMSHEVLIQIWLVVLKHVYNFPGCPQKIFFIQANIVWLLSWNSLDPVPKCWSKAKGQLDRFPVFRLNTLWTKLFIASYKTTYGSHMNFGLKTNKRKHSMRGKADCHKAKAWPCVY